MNGEQTDDLERRAAKFAAIGDPTRLRIVEELRTGDAMPSELSARLGIPSNLLAHHLRILERAGLLVRSPSEGDRRRSYLRFDGSGLPTLAVSPHRARRVLFVCTANSARSHLAAALWRRASELPSASAGTHPADRIDSGALAAARRHRLPMQRVRPRRLDEVKAPGDLIITVCDLAHEELADLVQLHWSIPDPVRLGTDAVFDRVVDSLAGRIEDLAATVVAS